MATRPDVGRFTPCRLRVSDVAEVPAVSAPVPGREGRGLLLDYLGGRYSESRPILPSYVPSWPVGFQPGRAARRGDND